MDINEVLNNPLAIQKTILSQYESNLDGDLTVVDSSNSFNFLLEAFSRVSAEITNATDRKLNSVYPKRATLTEELYHHLSDFDYVGFYSFPSSLKMTIMMHRQFLMKNAVQVPNTNYKMVVIPAETVIQVGRFSFGLYYPIQVRINSSTGTVSGAYDTSKLNPLHILSTNNIQVRKSTYDGIELIQLEFDVYQFIKKVATEAVQPEIGFNKSYKFEDRFYAIRIFDTVKNKELAYTMSDSVYDPTRPTVKLKVYPESNEINVTIPQIYLTTGQIGNQLKIELYQTQGKLDASLANIRLEDIQANFALETSPDRQYSTILKNIPTMILAPVDTRLIGGSNGYTFQQMKDFTIYRTDTVTTPIGRIAMERFFESRGFKYSNRVDNLTDRRYYAYRQLFLKDTELGVVNGSLTINAESEIVNDSIRYLDNNTIVILPTAIFRYIQNTSSYRPIDDNLKDTLKTADPQHLTSILREQSFFCQPNHWVISKEDRYPHCVPYDLLSTDVKSITFDEENIHLSAQMSLVSATIKHLGEGSKGYVVRVGIQKSEELAEIPVEDFTIALTVSTREGYTVGITGNYIGVFDEVAAYDFFIETNYKLNDNRITTLNLTRQDGATQEFEIFLEGKMQLATFVDRKHYPGIQQNHNIRSRLVAPEDRWLAVSLQSFTYKLGSDLRDVIDPNLLTTWTGQDYERHPETVYMTYERDVYETNPDGTLKYTTDIDGNIVLNKLHSAGDPVLDTDTGDPVIKHIEGSYVLDAKDDPIPIVSRTKDFTFELFSFSFQHRAIVQDFLIKTVRELDAYYNSIREMDQQVLENTQIFFRPINSSGSGVFKLNNVQRVNMPLELWFEFNIFLNQASIEDPEIITMIEEQTVIIVKKHLTDSIITVTSILRDIQETLTDYINSVDFVGLNGDHGIQTLMPIETDKVPRLSYELRVTQDNRIETTPRIKFNYKALDV